MSPKVRDALNLYGSLIYPGYLNPWESSSYHLTVANIGDEVVQTAKRKQLDRMKRKRKAGRG